LKFGNFSEITCFFELAKISQKSLEKSLEAISCFWVKKPCFWFKKFKKTLEKVRKQGFPNIWNLEKFWKLFYSKLSKNYEKMTLNLNLENCEKLVPTRKPTQTFG